MWNSNKLLQLNKSYYNFSQSFSRVQWYFLAHVDISFFQPKQTFLEEFWINSLATSEFFSLENWLMGTMNYVSWLGDLILLKCSGFTIPQVKRPQERSCLWIQLLTFLCVSMCAHTHSYHYVLRDIAPSCGNRCGVPPGPSTFASMDSPAQTGRRGGWPALAREEAGPRAACARCGDAWIPPRRSHPSHAGEGSGSDGWYRGSPRECGFLGWGSPSSGAVHTASPRERERRCLELTCSAQSSRGWLACRQVPSHFLIFFRQNCPHQPGKMPKKTGNYENQPMTT